MLVSVLLKAQINLSIKEMNIYNINNITPKNTINEGVEDGPFIDGVCVLNNNTDSTVVLYPSKSKIRLLFRYKEKLYSTDIFPLAFIENDTIILLPKQIQDVSFGVNLLLGTGILNKDRKNYTNELLEILPTIKISYEDKGLNIKSSEITNVNVR